MNKNDIVTVEITDIGVSGEGIGHVDGYTLFIKDAVIGDVVEAKVMKAKKNYGYARLMKVLTPSEYRVEPKCVFARRCGGCQIQEMSYDRQLVFKDQKIRGNLERIGGFTKDQIDTVMQPVVGMEHPFGYRNKAQFPFGTDKEGNPITGFYAGRTHDIIANTDCALGVEQNKEILEIILQYMRENKIKSYDEKTGKGLIRHALIRYGFKTKEIMVCLVVNGKKLPKAERLIEKLIQIEGMTSITISPNTRRDNVIMGDSYEILWGQGYITDYIGNVKYQISPLSFYQVNPVQTEKLYGLALEYADLKGDETVWDLYCGIGTISLFLAQKAKQVYGVEIVPQAIDDAKENAKINAIDNAEFFVGKAEEVLPEYYAELINSGDEAKQLQAANQYGWYERVLGAVNPSFGTAAALDDAGRQELRIYLNYAAKAYTLKNNQIMRQVKKISHLPALLIHNRLDMDCPLYSAYQLHLRMPASKLVIAPGIGHYNPQLKLLSAVK